jgi:hypothetical protein
MWIQVQVVWVVTLCIVVVGYRHFRAPCCLHPQGEVEGFWIVTPCSVLGYQCFGGPWCLHLQGEVGNFRVVTRRSIVVGDHRFRGLCCLHPKGEFDVFRVMAPCIIVVGYQRFRGSGCLHLQREVKLQPQKDPPKRRYPITTLYGGVTNQETTYLKIVFW